jgi:hypothetical protein
MSLAETGNKAGDEAGDDKARGPNAFKIEPRAPQKRQGRPAVDDPGRDPAAWTLADVEKVLTK